ncbi:TPA: hypothetical protein ACOIAO_003473 [Clostridioides difficile]
MYIDKKRAIRNEWRIKVYSSNWR